MDGSNAFSLVSHLLTFSFKESLDIENRTQSGLPLQNYLPYIINAIIYYIKEKQFLNSQGSNWQTDDNISTDEDLQNDPPEAFEDDNFPYKSNTSI